jgi:putative phage exonuclease
MSVKRKRKKSLLVLVDADMVAFRAASSAEQEIRWGESDLWTLHSFLPDAVSNMQHSCFYAYNRINDILFQEQLPYTVPNWTRWIYCFSDRTGGNFRKQVLLTYKANRADKRKPLAYHALVDYMCKELPSRWEQELEADDIIGLLAYKAKQDVLIISGDKDLRQIPDVWYYNFLKAEMNYVSQQEADFQFYKQALMGDPTDGYPGCPGVGEKKAEELLMKHGMAWKTLVDAYAAKGLTEADALVQARCAYILHSKGDYNKSRTLERRVRLWTPTTAKESHTSAETS